MKRKLIFILALVSILVLVFAGTALAKTYRGWAEDPHHPGLGMIKYLGNPAGYHFWFTPTKNIGHYIAGHSYHNIYKISVEDPSEWCGPVNIPDRPPYNQVGHTGKNAYYKIWDITAEMWICP